MNMNESEFRLALIMAIREQTEAIQGIRHELGHLNESVDNERKIGGAIYMMRKSAQRSQG